MTGGSILVTLALLSSPDKSQTAFGQPAAAATSETQVRIGVLGLFRPRELTVRPAFHEAASIKGGDERVILESSSGPLFAGFRISDSGVLVQAGPHKWSTTKVEIAGRHGESVDFILAVPGKIHRRYRGTLQITASGGALTAVLATDLETAVASVVAAESVDGTPMEALKAQAVVTRSYLLSGSGRHRDFDFCDTTHCQLLRETPAIGSGAFKAVAVTRGMVLSYSGAFFSAMYTRSCSGQTHTPTELGMKPGTYPYYPVECIYCRSHPAHWTSRISSEDAAALRSSDESSRLKLVRRIGWNSVPSNDFTSTREGTQQVLQGLGRGHGIGLCQAGAQAMAEQGASFREIVAHYYPNTNVVQRQGQVSMATSGE